MPIYLKQSTASQEIPLGYFVDSTDGNTEETGLTIANTDIKLWKCGATTLANKNSGGATHISNGVYYCVLDATDTGTLGSLVVFVHVSGALSVKVECVVLAANVYDSLIGGGDVLDVSTTQLSGTSCTARDIGASVLLSPGTGTGQISLSSGAVTVGTNNDKTGYTASTVSDKTGYSLAASQTFNVTGNITGNVSGSVGSVTNMVSANVTQISGDATAADNAESFFDGTGYAGTNNVIPSVTTVTNLTNAPTSGDLTATMKASVTAAVPTVAGISDGVWDEVLSGHLTSGTTGNALNAAGSAGDPWATALPGAYGSGTAGKIIGDNINATISSRSTLDAAGVRTAVGLSSANLDTQLAALPTDADVNAACDTAISDASLATAAELAKVPKSDSNVTFNATALASINAQCDTAISDAALATASALATVDTNVDTIVSKLPSGNIGDATAANQTTIMGYIDTEVAAIKTQTDKLVFTGSYVNAQVKASDNIDFGALQKTSLNAATPSVTVSDKTGFSLTADYDSAKTASQFNSSSDTVTVGTNNDKTGYTLSATGSAALTESYATKGSAPTLPQILHEIRGLLAEKSISGTTLTTKKIDGSTTAETFTLDSATAPTSITRAS